MARGRREARTGIAERKRILIVDLRSLLAVTDRLQSAAVCLHTYTLSLARVVPNRGEWYVSQVRESASRMRYSGTGIDSFDDQTQSSPRESTARYE